MVSVSQEDVKFESDVGVYKSSEIAVRKFCTSCGTPIAFQFVEEAAKAKQVWHAVLVILGGVEETCLHIHCLLHRRLHVQFAVAGQNVGHLLGYS